MGRRFRLWAANDGRQMARVAGDAGRAREALVECSIQPESNLCSLGSVLNAIGLLLGVLRIGEETGGAKVFAGGDS